MAADPFEGIQPPGGVDYGTFTFHAMQWVLAKAADAVSSAVPCSAPPGQPVLTCLRVRVTTDSLQFTATDLERTIYCASKSMSAEGVQENAYAQVFLPAKKLRDILREAPEGSVTVEVRKDEAEVTVAGGGSWLLRLPDPSVYPVLTDPYLLAYKSYSRDKLLDGLRAVQHVICKDASRPTLTQVSIAADSLNSGALMTVTASDGTRFARARLDDYPEEMCISAAVLPDLTKLLRGAQAEEVGIACTPETLAFRAGDTLLAVARRASPFPDMDRLLLKPALENSFTLTVDKDDLAAAVRRVRINADESTSAIVLEAEAGKLTVVSRDKAGNSAHETIPATWAEAKRTLCVNHGSLTEMLAAHPGKTCALSLGTDHGKKRSPVLLASDTTVQVIAQMPASLIGY